MIMYARALYRSFKVKCIGKVYFPTHVLFIINTEKVGRYCMMAVERIHPKAPVMLIFIAIFTCLPSCINLSNIINTVIRGAHDNVPACVIQ